MFWCRRLRRRLVYRLWAAATAAAAAEAGGLPWKRETETEWGRSFGGSGDAYEKGLHVLGLGV